MNWIIKSFSAITLSLNTAVSLAAPIYLITHNNTQEQSNAYIDGTVPSLYPTAANTTQKVHWNMVKLACYGHADAAGNCSAVIKMATNTEHSIELGTVIMNLNSGEIRPKRLANRGYLFTVEGLGEVSINQNLKDPG